MIAIAGTGRCGTRWLARVLAAAGVAAGHERVHTPEQVVTDLDVTVDVSWLALTHPVNVDLIVGREPVGCIGSLVDCGLFTTAHRYRSAVERAIPLSGDAFADACRWWCWVNTRPIPRWRLDQPERLRAVLATLGVDVSRVDPYTPPDGHPTPTRTTTLTWGDLPAEVIEVAAEWGWHGS